MKKFAPLLFSLLFAVPCFCFAAAPKAAPGNISLDFVMVAMADNMDGTGVWLVEWLRAKNAVVKFDAALTAPSAWRVEGAGKEKRPIILINENIRGRTNGYKYYAALIGREAAELVHIGVPESAEKRYMINACAAEVYFELFGTRAELPVFSGVRDEALAEQVNTWVENGPDSGPSAIARQTGIKLLKNLISETELALAQAQQDGVDAAPFERRLAGFENSKNYYENEFKGKETYWWTLFQPQ
ncbi:MAG: hypothetical protein A2234_07680 [Elusimicrobia bacterium RIFOXYA2_FULL_58_8]|nr:MAG: hypothetical protein A2234_07680 [Elusimicrobia bacterium RIFOXYA2_FULL_58_8]OGS13760.1 MAG: hypothetical protein A2285_03415 [Elusimicrobia bacterium RIFOXYA12_FULL_57_11]